MADRRTFMQGLAATVAIPDAVPAQAADSEPDAELIALGHEWAISRERLDLAWEEHDAAADRYGDGPPPPPDLFVRQSDGAMPYYASKHQPSGLAWYGTPSVMERIRNLALDRMPAGILLDGSVRPAVPDLPAQARRAEIEAAYEDWQAACATAVAACGLTAAIDRTNAEIEINSALRRQIIDIPAVTLIGYARTSTLEQEAGLEAQQRELKAIGAERIFAEQTSSAGPRQALEEALEFCRSGDTFVVTKLDRLARSVLNLWDIIGRLEARGIALRILNLGLDTGTPTGKLMLTIMGGIAEFERAMMLERQREGIAKAKGEGKYKGRKPSARLKSAQIEAMAAAGASMGKIAKELGIGKASVHRVLRADGPRP